MLHNIKYIGCFLDYNEIHDKIKELGKERLEVCIKHPHITFAYHPQIVDVTNFGKVVRVRAIGYGNNSVNEGLLVKIITDDLYLKEMIKLIEVPHITISMARIAEPVDTGKLDFKPIEPFELKAVFGAYTFDDRVIF